MKTQPHLKGITAPSHFSEANDCSVRALANATGHSYEDCHAVMKSLGRKDGQFMDMKMCAAGCFKMGGQLFIVESLDDYRLKQGKYVVFVQQHCYALIDGEVVDTIELSSSAKLFGVFNFKGTK